jgi:RHS repeat-associated protein
LTFSASGSVVTTYRYDAFGAVRSQSSPHDNRWLFAGEQRDSESGYDYLRNRYYDPEVGRFLSQDPIMADHPYVYVRNNPVRFIDPSGLYAICGDHETWGYICFDSTQVGLSPSDIWGNCYVWTPEGKLSLPGPPDWCNSFYCYWFDWPPQGHVSRIELGDDGPRYGLLTCNAAGGKTVTCYSTCAGGKIDCCYYWSHAFACGYTMTCGPEDWGLPQNHPGPPVATVPFPSGCLMWPPDSRGRAQCEYVTF